MPDNFLIPTLMSSLSFHLDHPITPQYVTPVIQPPKEIHSGSATPKSFHRKARVTRPSQFQLPSYCGSQRLPSKRLFTQKSSSTPLIQSNPRLNSNDVYYFLSLVFALLFTFPPSPLKHYPYTIFCFSIRVIDIDGAYR